MGGTGGLETDQDSAEADATQTKEHCEMCLSKSSVMSNAAEYLKSFCGLSQ